VKGEKGGIRDSAGNELGGTTATTFTTGLSPMQGPGGPLLIITSKTNPFSGYYAEILRAEGFNEFATIDIDDVSAAVLSHYELAILGDFSLNPAQVAEISQWVWGGGKLIAMHPGPELADLLGIAPAGSPLAEGYFSVEDAGQYSKGFPCEAMQFHGEAGQYTLNGAIALAQLYRDSNTAAPRPAATLRQVGNSGGMAGAFLFDVARSVVLTRQGNPAWAGQRRTGSVWGPWTMTADLFCGWSKNDPQKDWVDRKNLAIPQADELQRFLAGLIIRMNLAAAPLPRFNYFPDGARALVILTGDDHNCGGTLGRFSLVKSAADSADMPIGTTSYLFPGNSNSDEVLASFAGQGCESALHFEVTGGALFGAPGDAPADWLSFSQLDYLYTSEQFIFEATYPSLPSPRTVRVHGPVWSDYDSLPQVELAHGVRLDTSYYFAPPQWVQDHPGLFTGSGLPMRFATAKGSMIDVYQVPTQITDESGQSEPRTINTLLDNATGARGYFAAIAVNAHTDEPANPLADAAISAAKAHHVAILSAENLLDFEDARGNSFFADHSFNPATGRLMFTIDLASGANRLQTLVPLVDAQGGEINSITLNGQGISFDKITIGGVHYGAFEAQSGPVVVQYNAGK
jgi:hypothetical protein